MNKETLSFSERLALLPGEFTIFVLWLSDWSSPAFQQLSGVTQTCTTKSLGVVWRMRAGIWKGMRSAPGMAFEVLSGQVLCTLGRILSWVTCMWVLQGYLARRSSLPFEHGSSLSLGVPLHLRLLFPTWVIIFLFPL